MTMQHAASHLDDLRTALAQGMTHWVGGLVKAALIAGCTRSQVMQAASEVGPIPAREALRRALDDWSWLEQGRRAVAAERTIRPRFGLIRQHRGRPGVDSAAPGPSPPRGFPC